jgi:hypothetical protein
MKSYYYIIDKLREALLNEPFTNTVSVGSLDDIDNWKQSIFPLTHIIVNSVTPSSNVLTFNVSIIAMDVVDISKENVIDKFIGNDNEQDVLNTQLIVLIRLCELIRRGYLNDEMDLEADPTMEPFTERFENYLSGWTMTIDILVPNEMSIC